MRVFACIDAPGNGLATTREVPISVHLWRPVPAGRVQPASVQSAKVLPLLLFIQRGNALFVHFKRIAGVSNWPLTVCFRLGKVWPVGALFLLSSQRGKGHLA